MGMKFLLVSQYVNRYKPRQEYCMPLGIAYMNGALRTAGFDVYATNLLFAKGDPIAILQRQIREWKIDALLCGGLTAEYTVLKEIYDAARDVNCNIILIGGGGGFSSEPIVFSELTGVDYAVLGEGEMTICELAATLEKGLDVEQVKGIAYYDKVSQTYRLTEERPVVENLDSIPFPSYEGLDIETYLAPQTVDGWYNYYSYYSDAPRLMPMLMSRSCPYQCSFCYHPMGRQYRRRSLENFFMELDLWIETYAINGIALLDECFSVDAEQMKAFCVRIKPYRLAWACQMRAETYTNELLTLMKDAGCIGACFGIESLSNTVLKSMNKHLDRATIENALSLTYQHKIGCTGNLIFGAEGETLSTVADSLTWCDEHAAQYSNYPIRQFSYVQTYPGCAYYKRALQSGKIPDKKQYILRGDWDLNITSMSNEDYRFVGDIIRLKRREIYNCGTVLAAAQISESRLDLTLQCAYCKGINHYHGVNASRAYSDGRLKRLGCRHCNMLGDYIFDAEQYRYQKYYVIPWALGLLRVDDLSQYFSDKGYHRIGIYGKNAFEQKLVQALAASKLVCLVLKNLEHIPELRLDVIVNADVAYWKEADEAIRQFARCPVVMLEDIIRECIGKN